jgi:hypothetical protein
MARIDPEHERQRLLAFYSVQMDGELEKVASQAYELTDLAQEALRAELAKRGLRIQLVERAPVPVPPPLMPGDPPSQEPAPVERALEGELELREMVTIRRFRDVPEALLARGTIQSAGIECVLVDDNIVRTDWFWSNAVGGVKLQVSPDDVEVANGILDQPIPEGFEVAGIGEYLQPRCPKCQSLDVAFQELDAPVAFVSAYFNVPIPLMRRAWRCHSCNVEWEEDGAPDPSRPDFSA